VQVKCGTFIAPAVRLLRLRRLRGLWFPSLAAEEVAGTGHPQKSRFPAGMTDRKSGPGGVRGFPGLRIETWGTLVCGGTFGRRGAVLVSHPSDKNKGVAWMGHPGLWWNVRKAGCGRGLPPKRQKQRRRVDGAPWFVVERSEGGVRSWSPTQATKTKASRGWGTRGCGGTSRWLVVVRDFPGPESRPGAPWFVVERSEGRVRSWSPTQATKTKASRGWGTRGGGGTI
jgi:hypothetical protein